MALKGASLRNERADEQWSKQRCVQIALQGNDLELVNSIFKKVIIMRRSGTEMNYLRILAGNCDIKRKKIEFK